VPSQKIKDADEDIPDWTSARRKRLGTSRPTAMLTPQDARAARQLDGEIPVIFHTLFTCDEITNCLQSLGGLNVAVIPLPIEAHMGKAMIVATGTTGTHLRTMADALVRSLRARKLHKMGVIGADSGAEGYDCDDWIVVDCRNYTVHLQDEITRKHIALEKHWSPEEVSKRRRNPIDSNDEDAIDDFVRDNPIPDEYARTLFTNATEEATGVGFDAKKLRKTTVLPLVPSRRRPMGGKVKGSKGSKRR
jgi:ribosome-associated protein